MAENIRGLADLRKRFDAITDKRMLLGQLALLGVREAQMIARGSKKTGNLIRTIRVQSFNDERAVVVVGANYARYVEYGTRPHIIRPRNAKALRFAANASGRRLTGSPRKGAQVVFARSVRHPGTKAQPFLVPGLRRAVERSGTDVIVGAWNGAA